MTDLNLMAEKIRDILLNVPNIKEAYDYEPQSMNLPAATVFFDRFEQSDQTTMRKSVDWSWIIRIYIPIRTSDIKKPQIEVRSFIETTIKQFRSDLELGGTCLYHNIASGEVIALLEQANPMLVAELFLTATTEEF